MILSDFFHNEDVVYKYFNEFLFFVYTVIFKIEYSKNWSITSIGLYNILEYSIIAALSCYNASDRFTPKYIVLKKPSKVVCAKPPQSVYNIHKSLLLFVLLADAYNKSIGSKNNIFYTFFLRHVLTPTSTKTLCLLIYGIRAGIV